MEIEDDKSQDGVRAVGRALDILLAFLPGEELAVADLIKRVNLSRPTLYRLLKTLELNRFLVSTGDPQRFRFGSAVGQIAHVWASISTVDRIALPFMQDLWVRTQETVALFVQEGSYRRCVAELPSPQALSFKRTVGYRERLVLGASGRAILAHLPVKPGDLEWYSNGLQINMDTLIAELERVRNRGFAIAKEELSKGAMAIAAPFFDGSGRVAGSISIFGPTARIGLDEAEQIGHRLALAGGDISKALGKPLG